MPHRYNVPMVGLKEWYKEEISSVGHLAAMEDEYLQRMYASKVVSGMNHLVKALEERMEDASNADKKHEFELMMHSVKTAMAHVKADYDVSEDNITYKWNMNKNKNNQTPSVASEPALLAPSTNENNEANNEANNNNSLPAESVNEESKTNNNNNNNNNNNSLPGERVNLNQLVENNKNLAESNVLTLNELSQYIKGKTANPSRNNGESKRTEGGRRTRRKGKKSKRTRRH
jgi:hypothetical protein